MYSVLLVDDEVAIRRAFEALIDWEAAGFHIVATAADGLEALDILNKRSIDLVMTDIRMPRMDGIELARRIQEDFTDSKVILLSAYSEFSYAQQAISHGVYEYILKSETADVINRQLQKLRQHMDRERENAALEREENERLLWQHREALAQGWAQGKKDPRLLENAKLPALQEPLILAEVIMFEQQMLTLKYGEQTMFTTWLREREILETLTAETGFVFSYLRRLFLATNTRNILQIALQKLNQEPWETENFLFSIAYLDQKLYTDSLPNGFREILPTEYETFRQKSGTIYSATEPVKTEPVPRDMVLRKLADQIVLAVARKDLRDLNKALNALENEGNLRSVQSMRDVQFILRDVFRMSSQDIVMKNVFDALVEEMAEYTTVNGVLKCISERLISVIEENTIDTTGTRTVILAADQYMKLHFAENLSLQGMAERFAMSPGYFSKLYAKEIGCNYIERLTDLRIDRAKQLLRETNDRVYEIANAVGYRKTRHFSEIFRRYTGKNPIEYREYKHTLT